MDKNPLISKLNKSLPGAVLETRRFGRSGMSSIWVEAHAMDRVAEILKNDPELKLDWLENFSVVEFENALVVSYFIRSISSPLENIIRASIVPASPEAVAMIPSVCHAWPMALLFEQEAEEMFGIQFLNRRGASIQDSFRAGRLPKGWKGFPLRKKYEFPKEFAGIVHSRPFNKSNRKRPVS